MRKSRLDAVTVIKPNSTIWPITFKEFWKWRELFYRLVLREFQVRFRDTYLGYLWIFIQPILTLVVILLFIPQFSDIRISIPYKYFVVSGLIFWFYISNAFSHASISLVENQSLIIQTNIKRALIPIGIITSKLFDLSIALFTFALVIYFDPNVDLRFQIFYIFLDVLGMSILLVGTTMITSALCVRFKDVRYVIPFLAQTLFFTTPVFYMYAEGIKELGLVINPYSVFIMAVRDHIFGTHFITPYQYINGFGLGFALLIFGALIFRRFERTFADVI